MDNRWDMDPLDSKSDVRVFLQPTASIEDVQAGVPEDQWEITPWVTSGSQSAGEVAITVNFEEEFLGANQPFSQQVINVMAPGPGGWQNLWIGIVESISSYSLAFGQQSMTLTCRTRETQDVWKLTKYSTQLYPQGTNLTQIINDVLFQVGMDPSEILVPPSTVVTSHSNTQLAGVSAWEMIQTLFLPMGQVPIIDCLGRLRGVSKDLWGTQPTITYDDESRLMRVNATRVRPPTTRYILEWLDPNLSKSQQVDRKLAECTMTAGFFTPILWKHLTFSPDGTQRAENTYLHINTSVNQFRIGGTTFLPCFLELWNQDTEIDGRLMIITLGWTYYVLSIALEIKKAAAHQPDNVVVGGVGGGTGFTIPVGRVVENAADIAIFTLLAAMGTGDYEIWGNPYDWIHARNTSEAYNQDAIDSVPWADNPVTVECDLIMDEAHAKAVCTRELIYLSASASSWTVTIVDDKRIEKGDIIEFSDGSQMYVLDFTRSLTPGSSNNLDVKGFLVSQNG